MVDTVAAVVGEFTQNRRDVSGDRRDLDVRRDPGGCVDDVGDGGVTEAAEPDPEVERSADDDDEVGALLEQPAGAEEGERVAGRQHAATQPVEEARDPEVLGRRGERLRRAVPVGVAADEEGRALCRRDHRRQPLDGVVVDRLVPQPGAVGDVASAGPKRSSGKSRKTGPRWRWAASRTASWTTAPAVEGSVTVAASLVIGASTGTWSNSWSEPAPHRAAGARPPRTTRGDPLNIAVVTAEMPLVTPGPAVSAATPGRRVSLAYASAANVADCSWRVSTMRISVPRAAS